MIVDRFDRPALTAYFENLVARCTGADRTEVATKPSRYGLWEFEDYRAPSPDPR